MAEWQEKYGIEVSKQHTSSTVPVEERQLISRQTTKMGRSDDEATTQQLLMLPQASRRSQVM